MDDVQNDSRVAQNPEASADAGTEAGTGATAVAAARLLANPRRVRRA